MKYYEDLNDILDRLEINNIITNDIDAYTNLKNYRIIYNKLWLSELQNINCGPIGTDIINFPVIMKPIINLYGMSRGFKLLKNYVEYIKYQKDGHFWMDYLKGNNYTIDIILDKGKIVNIYCLESKPSINGTFKYHVYRPKYKLSEKIKNLIEDNFKNYTGPMNIEVINNRIIEGHLRLNGDLYLYNDLFFKNLSNLIDNKKYKLIVKKKKFYLFPYFVNYNFNLKILSKKEIEQILLDNNIDNIRWDDINDIYQRKDLKRLLMFKCNKLNIGKQVIELIKKNLFLRNKIYNNII